MTDQNRGANLIKKRKTSVKFGIKASFLRFGMRTRMKYLIEPKIFKLMVILIVLITGVLPHTTEDHLDVVYGLAEIQRNEQFYIIISNKESSIHEYVEMITADLSSQIKLVTWFSFDRFIQIYDNHKLWFRITILSMKHYTLSSRILVNRTLVRIASSDSQKLADLKWTWNFPSNKVQLVTVW